MRKRVYLQKENSKNNAFGTTSMGVQFDTRKSDSKATIKRMQRKAIRTQNIAFEKKRRPAMPARKRKQIRSNAKVLVALVGFCLVSVFFGDAIFQVEDQRTSINNSETIQSVEATNASTYTLLRTATPTQSSSPSATNLTIVTQPAVQTPSPETSPLQEEKQTVPEAPSSPKPDISVAERVHVFVPDSGSRYHAIATCSGMVNPKEVTLIEAKGQGFTACKRCNPIE